MSNCKKDFHNKIADICFNHFSSLPKTGKPSQNEWTVLSCIVMENTRDGNFGVVALGTGSKCIGSNKMSPHGDVLNDSHAEVICRRSFLRYLYEEIALKSGSNIFEFNEQTKIFALNEQVAFHFFTTHVPCGDAAIFLKQDPEDVGNALKKRENVSDGGTNCYIAEDAVKNAVSCTDLKRKAEAEVDTTSKKLKAELGDIFRTGAKCLPDNFKEDMVGEGANYHVTGEVRTKPGRGDPTLSVSCSDKLSKWCHVGIQGALLSILLKTPIYLRTFTIAGNTHFCSNALRRALNGRLNAFSLKLPFCPKEIIIGQANKAFQFNKEPQKLACSASISWCKVSNRNLEVAVEGRKQGITKKNLSKKVGRLKICKREMFECFVNVAKEIGINEVKDCHDVSYKGMKDRSALYQEMWSVLKNDGFTAWTAKDESLLKFCL